MIATYALIWGSWIFFGLITVWGLTWAIRTGQLSDLSEAATVIFDEEEPLGAETDRFPKESWGLGEVSRASAEVPPWKR